MQSLTFTELSAMLSEAISKLGDGYPTKGMVRLTGINNYNHGGLSYEDKLNFGMLIARPGEKIISINPEQEIVDVTGCPEWEPGVQYGLNQVIWYGSHAYRVSKATPKETTLSGKTGNTIPNFSGLQLGEVFTDGTFDGVIYHGPSNSWPKEDQAVEEGQCFTNSPWVVICDKAGTTGVVPSAYDQAGWEVQKTGFTSGTAHFKTLCYKNLVWWGSGKEYADGQICICNNKVLEYHMKTIGTVLIAVSGQEPPTHSSGTKANGDYELIYIGEVRKRKVENQTTEEDTSNGQS